MTFHKIKDADGNDKFVDVFVRDEGGTPVEQQGVVIVDPANGNPARPDAAGNMPVAAPALGAPTDAEAAGASDGSIIGLLKRLRSLLGGTLNVALPATQRSASGAVLIGNNKSKLRDEFAAGGLDPNVWEVVGSVGTGMSFSTGNGTTGSYLLMSSGVDINSETIIRSKDMFTLPVRLAAFVTASQRIANTEFFVELLEVNPTTGDPVTVIASQTNAGTYKNHAAVKFDGTTATSALVSVRSGGAPEFVSAASTITTTAATGVSPNFFPAGFIEMQATGEHVALLQAAIDSTAAATVARRITQAAPNPDAVYKLQFRLRNLGTAPASSTDYRVHAVRLFDYTRHTVEIIGGPGHNAAAQAVPVNVAGGSLSITNTSLPVAGTAAHSAAASGNPVQTGGVVGTANDTTLAAGDAARLFMTTGQALLARTSIPETDWSASITATTTAATVLRAAAGTGLRNYTDDLSLQNTGASATVVTLADGATTLAQFNLPAAMTLPAVFPFQRPKRGTANTAVNITMTVASTVIVNAGGYVAP